jgi:hypothetical protein
MDEVIQDLKLFKDKDYEHMIASSYVEDREKNCKLKVRSEPPEAKVYVDGKFEGKAPLTKEQVDYREHKILLTKSGYEDYEEEIALTPGKRIYELNITLKKEEIQDKQSEESLSKEFEETVYQEPETKRLGTLSSEELTRRMESEGEVEREEKVKEGEVKERKLGKRLSWKSILIPVVVTLAGIVLVLSLTKLKKGSVGNNSNNTNTTPVTASVSIDSVPEGADVIIDEERIGITPIKDYMIKEVSHTVLLRKEGYEDLKEVIEVKEGDKISKTYNLAKVNKGNTTVTAVPVSITSNPDGAKVYVDGKYIGDTPISNYKVSLGNHNIKVTKDGYNDYSGTFSLSSSDTAKAIPVVLLKKEETKPQTVNTGKLSVSSDPTGAKVYVNNEYKGITPITISLNEGKYTIRLSKENYDDSVRNITIEANKKLEISFNLKKTLINSVPIWATFHYDMQRTGQCPYDTSKNTGKLKWKYKTGNVVYSSPAIASDGTIYVGSFDNYLYAIGGN